MENNNYIGRIYKICSRNFDKIYIGSTKKSLARRLSVHIAQQKCSSSIIINAGDVTIELIEEYRCKDRRELTARENYYIELYKDQVVNIRRAFLDEENKKIQHKNSLKKYYIKHKTSYLEKNQKYHRDNIDKIHTHKNEKHTCLMCNGKYTTANKHQHLRSQKHQNALL